MCRIDSNAKPPFNYSGVVPGLTPKVELYRIFDLFGAREPTSENRYRDCKNRVVLL